jgi:hypothetical protein
MQLFSCASFWPCSRRPSLYPSPHVSFVEKLVKAHSTSFDIKKQTLCLYIATVSMPKKNHMTKKDTHFETKRCENKMPGWKKFLLELARSTKLEACPLWLRTGRLQKPLLNEMYVVCRLTAVVCRVLPNSLSYIINYKCMLIVARCVYTLAGKASYWHAECVGCANSTC